MGVNPEKFSKLMDKMDSYTVQQSELDARCARLEGTKKKWDSALKFNRTEDVYVEEQLAWLRRPQATQELREVGDVTMQTQGIFQDLLAREEKCLQFQELLVKFGREEEEVGISGNACQGQRLV